MSKRATPSDILDEPEDTNQNAAQGYSWEEEYKRSWDVIKEDGKGTLRQIVNSVNKQLRLKRSRRITDKIQRGIIRSLVVCLDLTVQMFEKDLHPNRFILTLGYLEPFIFEFLDQNPLSQIGLIATKDAKAYKLSELSGNPNDHTELLKNLISKFGLDETSLKLDEKGQSTEISILNSLKMCEDMLGTVPFHTNKEVLFIVSSLCSVDSVNVLEYIKQNENYNNSKIRVSIICLSAEVFLYKSICDYTNGTSSVPLNVSHYRDVLFDQTAPPFICAPEDTGTRPKRSVLINMGFPKQLSKYDHVTLCSCHHELRGVGYECPRCLSRVCDLPTDCCVCGLTLISSAHLARSYHHLFPLESFYELNNTQTKHEICFGCLEPFGHNEAHNLRNPELIKRRESIKSEKSDNTNVASGHFQCLNCNNEFCLECDVFIHDTLHNCPGC